MHANQGGEKRKKKPQYQIKDPMATCIIVT